MSASLQARPAPGTTELLEVLDRALAGGIVIASDRRINVVGLTHARIVSSGNGNGVNNGHGHGKVGNGHRGAGNGHGSAGNGHGDAGHRATAAVLSTSSSPRGGVDD